VGAADAHHVSSSARPGIEPFDLGAMPKKRWMCTVDEMLVHAPLRRIFEFAREVDRWAEHLPHYRWVRFHQRATDGGGLVEMAAWRPFGSLRWPTWWMSEMSVNESAPNVRYRHVAGITKGMEVEWSFIPQGKDATRVRIVHLWNGPSVPLLGIVAAKTVIGPVFVHGIASRTLAGLAAVAERGPGLSRG
jgi:ribosome-associated toxin RatA of RatAB toxin-antitoxin module